MQVVVVPAAQYIVSFAKPFMERSSIEKAGNAVLELYRPSEPLTDFAGDTIAYLRITDTSAAHPASDIEPIRARLADDVKRQSAQGLALARANDAVAAIKSSGRFEVPGANVSTVTVNPPRFGQPIPPELGLTGAGFEQFHYQLGQQLLGDPGGQPVAALDVSQAQKVFVAQRIGLRSNWSSEKELDENRIVFQSAMTERMALPKSQENEFGLTDKFVLNEWLSIDAVNERNGWKSAEKSDSKPR